MARVDVKGIMNPKLSSTFDRHAAATFDKQLFLNDIVGELDWEFSMDTGVLGFGGTHRWHAQVLGTQSEQSDTWMWGWANEESTIPDNLLACANSLRKLGDDKGISEMTEARLPADELDGHFWAILATGLYKANAYYRGPYEGGAIYLLIKDTQYVQQVDNPLVRLATVFPQAISTYAISNHKHALTGHAEFLGLSVQPQGNATVVADSQGKQLSAEFDDQNRLTNLSGDVS